MTMQDNRTEWLLKLVGEPVSIMHETMMRFASDENEGRAWCHTSANIKTGDVLVRNIDGQKRIYEVIDTKQNNGAQEMQVRRISE